MVGAILGGGMGRRMGGAKATRTLAGRPLAAYPADALLAVCERVALVGKRDSELPALAGVEYWYESDDAHHPLAGIVHALATAGEPVLVCAADMPFVTPAAVRTLVAAAAEPVTVARAGERLQPLLAVYGHDALPLLRAAERHAPLTGTVASLEPRVVEIDMALCRSVDTPAQLAAAERELLLKLGGAMRPPPPRR